MSTWTAERARIASLSRSRPADDPDLTQARRNLKALKLAEYVQRVVAEAPPLTDAQLERVSDLLRPARSGGDAQ